MIAGPEERLEVDGPELRALELEALELVSLTPETIVTEEPLEPASVTPELLWVELTATLWPSAPPSNSDADVPPFGSTRPPHSSKAATTQIAAVITRPRLWNISLADQCAVSRDQAQGPATLGSTGARDSSLVFSVCFGLPKQRIEPRKKPRFEPEYGAHSRPLARQDVVAGLLLNIALRRKIGQREFAAAHEWLRCGYSRGLVDTPAASQAAEPARGPRNVSNRHSY
jgi:hypothetical protein